MHFLKSAVDNNFDNNYLKRNYESRLTTKTTKNQLHNQTRALNLNYLVLPRTPSLCFQVVFFTSQLPQ